MANDTIPMEYRIPLWRWTLNSAFWAFPAGFVFAIPVGYVVAFMWLIYVLFFLDQSFGPDPNPPVHPFFEILGDAVMYPGMAFCEFMGMETGGRPVPKDWGYWFKGSLTFGFPYACVLSFLLFTLLGFTRLNRSKPPLPSDTALTSPTESDA
ncbi:MAG: hypothetical protein FWE67_14920 [Planctomycetaceae bacterium]|nr:hypothetical protein [Planctomycetaceae bacterium]